MNYYLITYKKGSNIGYYYTKSEAELREKIYHGELIDLPVYLLALIKQYNIPYLGVKGEYLEITKFDIDNILVAQI